MKTRTEAACLESAAQTILERSLEHSTARLLSDYMATVTRVVNAPDLEYNAACDAEYRAKRALIIHLQAKLGLTRQELRELGEIVL